MPIYQSLQYKGCQIFIWEITEPMEYFEDQLHIQAAIKHPKRKIEFLAGRFLLKYALPSIDLEKIQISDIGKPFMADNSCHFSISHSYPYIAVAVHPTENIGLDIQIFRDKILDIQGKFLHTLEYNLTNGDIVKTTLLWNAKEAMFKWRGTGGQDFSEQLRIHGIQYSNPRTVILSMQVVDLDGREYQLEGFGLIDPAFSMVVCL